MTTSTQTIYAQQAVLNCQTQCESAYIQNATPSTFKTADGTEDFEADEQSLCAIALSFDKVIGARCFCVGNTYVVAVIITPFLLKSERDAYLNDVQQTLSQATSKNLYLTPDMDIYRVIKQDMTDIEKEKALSIVKSRLRFS